MLGVRPLYSASMPAADKHNHRPFDIVVWGATGFTGRLVVAYLFRRYPPGGGVRWAIAGRNEQKLAELKASLAGDSEPIEVIVANSSDAASLLRMARSARVILTTVGPYAKFGTGLIDACVKTGTDYCDLCGEVQWMRQMIDRYHAAAGDSSARIVMSCGFDSIPSDLGVFTLQAIALREHGIACQDVSMQVRALKGSASGGTIASMVNAIIAARADRPTARILANPYALVPNAVYSDNSERDQDGARYDDTAAAWTAPFVMASVNTRVVRRSNALLGYPWGRNFHYSEATITGNGISGRVRASFVSFALKAFIIANAMPLSRRMLGWFLPKPGEGPSANEQESGYFKMQFNGRTAEGDNVSLQVSGDRDPGYGSTSKMLVESAVCLAVDDIAVAGGCWTPASALGSKLQQRLARYAGIRFVHAGQDLML